MVGKKIGGFTYLHISSWLKFPPVIKRLILFIDYEWDIIKYKEYDLETATLIKVDNFDNDAEPRLLESRTVDLTTGVLGNIRKLGTQVYHHKWLMVSPCYKGFDYDKAQDRSLKIAQWKYNRRSSGAIKNWKKICIENGDRISNSYLKEETISTDAKPK